MSAEREGIAKELRNHRCAPRSPMPPVSDDDRARADRILALLREGGEPIGEVSGWVESEGERLLEVLTTRAVPIGTKLYAKPVQAQEPIGYVVVGTDGRRWWVEGRWLLDSEMAEKRSRDLNAAHVVYGYTYTVEPVGASVSLEPIAWLVIEEDGEIEPGPNGRQYGPEEHRYVTLTEPVAAPHRHVVPLGPIGTRPPAQERTATGIPIVGWDLASLTEYRKQAEVLIQELEAEIGRQRASAPGSILRLEGEYSGVRYGEAAIPEKITAAEVFERIRASAPEEEREAERKAFYAGMDAGTSMCGLGYLTTSEREPHFQKWLRATQREGEVREADPPCPRCGETMERVEQGYPRWMSADQFDAVKPGDWFCRCGENPSRGQSGYVYRWDRELRATQKAGGGG